MVKKRIANNSAPLVLMLILVVFLMMQHAKMVEARVVLHPCEVEGEVENSGPDHDAECGAHTSVPPTNTSVPPTNTSVPPTNTSVPPTNTSVPPTNTSVPPTNTSVPANTVVPANTAAPANTPVPTNTSIPVSTLVPKVTSEPTPNMRGLVKHAATPLQVFVSGDGIQVYFIGPDGTAQSGPSLRSVSNLVELHSPVSGVIELYNGTNPMSGKSVRIVFLPTEGVIQFITYYPDTLHDTDKSYVFTLNVSNQVTHQVW